MEPVPDRTTGRRADEIPPTQLLGASYPYSLAYDGLLQQREDTITHGTLTLASEQAISRQLYRLKEEAAKRALNTLRDLQGILHHERNHLSNSAARDNWASDRLPLTRQMSTELDQHATAIYGIIERVVQP
uniref:ORFY protein n=1 Tax=Cacao swollen shoot CD virus TaxID=1960255 RepID=A0A2H4U920_9VIRU|nr:ORFY protein [Cacao swollen shoot CD virus]